MICTLFVLLMLGLFAVALKLPLLIAIIHGTLPDPNEVALERSRKHAQTPSTLKPIPQREAQSLSTARAPTTAKVPETTTPSTLKSVQSPPPRGTSAISASPSSTSPIAPQGQRRDSAFGLLYTSPPPEDQQDDLTKIKGVASVLEEKLHDFGIFTYQQIIDWDDAMMEAFSEKLSFKDRVARDGWQEQCKVLHREKYGEA